jgi:hypothetical protein
MVYEAFCRDFETAWDAVAASPPRSDQGRGNFLFAIHSMILLEWACRVCAGDPKKAALASLSRSLHSVRPGYFTPLPTKIRALAADGVPLPQSPHPTPGASPLLWLLFDLIRNGLAHQYQQIVLRLSDGPVYVSLGGPMFDQPMKLVRTTGGSDHLAYAPRSGSLGLLVRPEWLYLDFRAAIGRSKLLSKGLRPHSLVRPDRYGGYPGLTRAIIHGQLDGTGHPERVVWSLD